MISARLLSLVDYFLHKSPYWSVNNYEKRVDERVRVSFLRYVEQAHKDGVDELEGKDTFLLQG